MYVYQHGSGPSRTPDLGGIAPGPHLNRRPRRYSCWPLMAADQTETMEALDTAELELPPLTEPPALEPGRPSWEPDDGDFT